VNFHNLPNSVDEETNQSQLTTKENGREWKKVLSKKVSPNLLKKNTPVFKQQTIMHGLHMNLKGKTWLINRWTSMVLSLVTRTQNKMAIPLQWTERDEGSMEEPVNQTISSSEGTKSRSNAVVGNHEEPKAKPAKRLNSNQAKEDSKRTESDQTVLNKGSVDKKP
jgi:hypothetical protein